MTPSVLYSGERYCSYISSFHHDNAVQGVPLLSYRDYTPYYPPNSLYNIPLHLNPSSYYLNSCTMAAPNPSELEDFQRLSDQYQAELPGPLIGEKLPMDVLATEYAQADPTYVVKTAALAQEYSRYRTIKGDGQCGWRATVFGYFETLLELGDVQMVQQERVRLQSFEDTMRMAGIDYDIIIDMFDFTWELFDDLQRAVERGEKNEAVVLDTLNDEIKSNSIVYHFKMMTSAYMQLRADQYEPFLEMPIADYRVSRIDPANQEIDQIGLQALTDAVIAPADFAIEVLYLDRSIGEEVTPHSFVNDAAGRPTIRLLYRPGHYDMIYKSANPMSSVQVYFQKDSIIPQNLEMADASDLSSDIQAYLFSPSQTSLASQKTSSAYKNNERSNALSGLPQLYIPQPLMMTTAYPVSARRASHLVPYDGLTKHPMSYASSNSTETPSPQQPPTPSSFLPPIPMPTSIKKKAPNEPQIRLSANCYNYQARHESVPLCTQTYGNAAALSTAHFRNQDFQPQMWRAEEEYLKL